LCRTGCTVVKKEEVKSSQKKKKKEKEEDVKSRKRGHIVNYENK